jgi:hypothetical protein
MSLGLWTCRRYSSGQQWRRLSEEFVRDRPGPVKDGHEDIGRRIEDRRMDREELALGHISKQASREDGDRDDVNRN